MAKGITFYDLESAREYAHQKEQEGYTTSTSRHAPYKVTLSKEPYDPALRRIIPELHEAGFGTLGSCQGHGKTGYIAITLNEWRTPTAGEREKVKAILRKHRISDITFRTLRDEDTDWSLALASKGIPFYSVEFPSVTKRETEI